MVPPFFFYRFIEVLLLILNICTFKVYNVIRYRYILQNGNPMNRGAWQATVHGILQARLPEWVAFPFSRGSFTLRSPALQVDSLPAEPQEKPKNTGVGSLFLLQGIFPTPVCDQPPDQCVMSHVISAGSIM